jgi:hypothetical protein
VLGRVVRQAPNRALFDGRAGIGAAHRLPCALASRPDRDPVGRAAEPAREPLPQRGRSSAPGPDDVLMDKTGP